MSRIKDIQNAILSITKEDLDSVPHSSMPVRVIPADQAKPKQLSNAIAACNAQKSSQRIAVIIDNTLFASGKDSIIFAEDGIYTSSNKYFASTPNGKIEIPMPVRYDELQSVNLLESKKHSDACWHCKAVFTYKDNRSFCVWLSIYAYYIVLAVQKILKLSALDVQAPAADTAPKIKQPEQPPVQDGKKEFEAGVTALENGDFENAAKFWEISASYGQEKAMYNLGVVLSAYNSPIQDLDKALYWYEKAADHGYTAAVQDMVILYGNEFYPTYEPQKALALGELLKKQNFEIDKEVAELLQKLESDANAGEKLFEEAEKACHTDRDYATAYQKYLECAETYAHPYAMKELGDLFWVGNGVQRSVNDAINWYIQAVEKGCIGAVSDVCKPALSFFTPIHLHDLVHLINNWPYESNCSAALDKLIEKKEAIKKAFTLHYGLRFHSQAAQGNFSKDTFTIMEFLAENECTGINLQLAMAYANGYYGTKDLKKAKKLTEEITPGTYVCLGRDFFNSKYGYMWHVLDNQDGKLLLLAEECHISLEYHSKKAKVSWEKSEVRDWLERSYTFFAKPELATILSVTNKNPGENDTVDRFFLLSLEDVKRYFQVVTDSNKKAKYRYVLKDDMAKCFSEAIYDKTPARKTAWCLRTAGEVAKCILTVDENGRIEGKGVPVDNRFGIRVAMWVDPLKK